MKHHLLMKELKHFSTPITFYEQTVPRKRICKIVQKVITTSEKPDLGITEYQDLINDEHSFIFRKTWLIIVLACLCTCCYQILDRIQWFLQSPVAVDINYMILHELNLPNVVVCSANSDYVNEWYKDHPPDNMACTLPINYLMVDSKGVNYSAIWNFPNHSVTIEKWNFLNDVKDVEITTSIDYSMFGQCTAIGTGSKLVGRDLRFNPALHLNGEAVTGCTKTQKVVTLKDIVDFRLAFPLRNSLWVNLKIGIKKYSFLDVKDRRCVGDEEFKKCSVNCIRQRISRETYCRLPFFPPSDKPPCTGMDAIKNYINMSMITLKPNFYELCNCIRPCRQNSYRLNVEACPTEVPETVVTIKIHDFQISLKERLAYDIISFFADVGGNIGLFMGLSILSILNMGITTLSWIRHRHLLSKNLKCDSIEENAMRQFKKRKRLKLLLQPFSKTSILQKNKSRSKREKAVWMIATLLCVGLSLFMIQQRIAFYFAAPTTFVIEVEELTRVTFPSATICGYSPKVTAKIGTQARSSNQNPCDVQLVDLRKKYPNYGELWKLTELKDMTDEILLPIIKRYMFIELMNYTVEAIPTYLGNCNYYNFAETEYAGMLTVFPTVFLLIKRGNCHYNLMQVFFDEDEVPPSRWFNLLSRIDLPPSALALLNLQIGSIHNLNTKARPCLEKELFEDCRYECLLIELQKYNLCGLPYLPANLSVTEECQNATGARRTRQIYIDVVMEISIEKTCHHCRRPCYRSLMEVQPITQLETDGQPFAVVLSLFNNVAEHVKERLRYSGVALFCDIGNSLGLALGVSILAIVRFFRLSCRVIRGK